MADNTQATEEARKIAKEAIDGSYRWDDMEDRVAFAIDNVAHRRGQQARDAALEEAAQIADAAAARYLSKPGFAFETGAYQIATQTAWGIRALKSTASGDSK